MSGAPAKESLRGVYATSPTVAKKWIDSYPMADGEHGARMLSDHSKVDTVSMEVYIAKANENGEERWEYLVI